MIVLCCVLAAVVAWESWLLWRFHGRLKAIRTRWIETVREHERVLAGFYDIVTRRK